MNLVEFMSSMRLAPNAQNLIVDFLLDRRRKVHRASVSWGISTCSPELSEQAGLPLEPVRRQGPGSSAPIPYYCLLAFHAREG